MTPPVPSAPTPAMRVLAWPAEANEELNPYNALLALHLRRLGVEVEEWSWQRLWTRSYDLLHLHWPDLLLQTPSGTRAAINAACLLLNLAVCRARGIKIVWTAHNLGSHEQLHPGMERCLWWSFTRLIDGYISLSATGKEALCRRFPALRPRPGFVIPHGNYQPSYPCSVEPAEARRRLGVAPDATVLGFFGRVRHDKNVPELVRAFRQLTRDDLVLLVAGEPEPTELGATVEHAAAADPRVRLRLEHIPPDEIQLVLGACDLVVLPTGQS